MTQYINLEEFMADVEAYRKSWRGRLYMFWHHYVIKTIKSPRTFYYYLKYFIQRGKRGYSDRDLWNAHTYLARMFAGILEQLADNKHGVGYPYYTEHENVDDAFKAMQDDYRAKAKLFRIYAEDDIARDKEWQDKYGGILEDDFNELMLWFVNRFEGLWD